MRCQTVLAGGDGDSCVPCRPADHGCGPRLGLMDYAEEGIKIMMIQYVRAVALVRDKNKSECLRYEV